MKGNLIAPRPYGPLRILALLGTDPHSSLVFAVCLHIFAFSSRKSSSTRRATKAYNVQKAPYESDEDRCEINLTKGFKSYFLWALKGSAFWDITPCSSLKVRWRFKGTFRFHLQGRISEARNYSCDILKLYINPKHSTKERLVNTVTDWWPSVCYSGLWSV
jgi:hypothetical protein